MQRAGTTGKGEGQCVCLPPSQVEEELRELGVPFHLLLGTASQTLPQLAQLYNTGNCRQLVLLFRGRLTPSAFPSFCPQPLS